MSTIISGRQRGAGRDEARTAWGRDEASMAHPTARAWPARSHETPEARSRPLSDALPAPRQRRGILSASLLLWLVVYVLLNVGDLLSTYFGLLAGLHEANPLMSGLLAQSGFGALIAYKLVVIVAVVAGAIALYRMHPRAAYLTVHVCNGLVFLAVLLNVAQMLVH